MAFELEVAAWSAELDCFRMGNLLVVLVDSWGTFVANWGLVLEMDHRDLGLWVFVGMQRVREEHPSDPQVSYWAEGLGATEPPLCLSRDVQPAIQAVGRAIHLNELG